MGRTVADRGWRDRPSHAHGVRDEFSRDDCRIQRQSSVAIQGIEPSFTPWAGGFERINAYAYFAWLVLLAVTVRRSLNQGRHRSEK